MTTEIRTRCYCGSSRFSFTIPSSLLPLPANLCHCNISRRISGAICTAYVAIPLDCPPTPSNWQKGLTAYHSSDILTRWFCTTCSTHMFLEYAKDGQLWIGTGTLDADTSDGIIDFTCHMWIEDSIDGGASDFVHSVSGKELPRWLVAPEESPQIPRGWRDKSKQETSHEDGEQPLKVRCHCGTVQMLITRPNEESFKVESPFPDLTHRAESGLTENPNNEPWWIDKDGRRYMTGTCLCQSCRLSTGHDIMSWVFVPLPNLRFPDGSAVNGTNEGLDADPRIKEMVGTVERDINGRCKRHFCRTCGATVFWWCTRRPRLIDVSTGLLDAPTGVRAEEWVAWHTDRVGFSEYALNKALADGLAEGIKEWKRSA